MPMSVGAEVGPPLEVNKSMTTAGVDVGSPGPPEMSSGPMSSQPTALPHGMPLSSEPTTEPMPEPAAEPTIWAQEAEEAREAVEAMRHLTVGLMVLARFRQRQLDHWPTVESEVAYDQGLHNGCPRCHKSDCLTRKRNSPLEMPLIFCLRCERCHLRIGSKRMG